MTLDGVMWLNYQNALRVPLLAPVSFIYIWKEIFGSSTEAKHGRLWRPELRQFQSLADSLSFSIWPITIRKVKSNVSSVGPSAFVMCLSDETPTLETLDFTFHIGRTPTFLYFDLYLNTAYAAHYVCFSSITQLIWSSGQLKVQLDEE